MQFELGEEQQQLRSGLDRLFGQVNDLAARTATVRGEPGWRPDLWQRLAEELGLLGIGLPEAVGGYGDGLDQLVVMEAVGRALLPEPLAETLFQCAPLLARHGAGTADLISGIIAGGVRLAMAVGEAGLHDDLAGIAMPASQAGDAWKLSGEKQVVIAAPWATHLLVAARTAGLPGDPDGLSLFVVPAGAAGLTLHAYRTIDERRAADVTFDNVVVSASALVGAAGQALPLLEEWRDRAIAAACAEASGLLERLLDDTVAYAKEREQFGQKIGSFQALQHRMVDMHLQLELVRSAALLACQSLDGPDDERARAASAAKVTLAQACRFIGQSAVQIHGGMGMTDDLPIGHYFKRATVLEHCFGSANWHLARRARGAG
jgi:alkylation response protein AidB-like acyl-CoA dehydrogenase